MIPLAKDMPRKLRVILTREEIAFKLTPRCAASAFSRSC
jgi:hypothetical protein